MKATFFKLERNEELIDVMSVRLVERNEIEIFVLTQAVGLLELLEKKVMLTSRCKKNVLSHGIVGELEDMGSDEDLLELMNRGAKLQGELTEVTDEVAEEAKVLKEALTEQLKIRLEEEKEMKKEWEEFYNFDQKTLREMHERTREWMLALDEC